MRRRRRRRGAVHELADRDAAGDILCHTEGVQEPVRDAKGRLLTQLASPPLLLAAHEGKQALALLLALPLLHGPPFVPSLHSLLCVLAPLSCCP